MLLSELTTPLQRHRVIEYASVGNNTVRRWREMRNVAGPIYMSDPIADEYGDLRFNLYLVFPDIPDGAVYQHDMVRPDLYKREALMDEIAQKGYDTPEHMVAALDCDMHENRFIGNVPITFVRQWNPERADTYAKYREEYYARKKERNRRLEQEREEQRKAESAKREAEDKAARAEYFGWADNMTAMRFGRVSAIMERLFRYDGVVMSRRQFVLNRVKEGWRPDKVEDQTSWRRIHLEWVEGKPHTEYRLVKDQLLYVVCKTEYEFARYLVEHGKLHIICAA